MIPVDFISQEELDSFNKIVVKNEYLIVKPLPVVTKTNIVLVHSDKDGKTEDKKSTKGVVMGLSDSVAERLDIKKGDVVGWSINNLHFKLMEVDFTTYLMLTPLEVACTYGK